MLLSYFLLSMYPFQNNTLLTIDMNNQYISFFSYLKEVLIGNDSLFYSFSKTMGGEMTGLAAYYLISPFNLLFIFSNVNNLPLIILIVTLLKIGSSGLTMFFLLNQEIKRKNALVFSLIYSMISYNIVYQQNIMWLDGVILLPLIVLGINYLITNSKKYVYVIALSLAIITNYYIGFMLSIFAVIYFTGKMTEKLLLNKAEFNKYYKRNIFDFITSSLLAGGLSAIVTIPTIFSLSGGKAEFDLSILTTTSNFDTIDFITKFFIGAFNGNEIVSGLPNIYTSLLILILVFGYFSTKHIEFPKKIISLTTLLVLFFSFKISGLNLIWHGFNFPAWFPYRYSFIFSFYLIYIASSSSKYFFEESGKIKTSIFTIFLFLSIIIEKLNYEYLGSNKITLSLLFVGIYLLLSSDKINLTKDKKYIVILLICSLELVTNNYLNLKNNSYSPITYYDNYITQNQPIIESLNSTDDFYRIEKTYYYNRNDALLFNYPGLTHYSSSEKTEIKDFLRNIGYRSNGAWASFSKGSSIAADSLMNIKYILSKDLELPYYDFLYEENDVKIYENPNVLPLGFMADETIKEKISYINPIQYIDEIYSTLGTKDSIYTKIPERDIDFNHHNVEENIEDDEITYSKVDPNDEAFIEFSIPVVDNNLITFYFLTNVLDGATLYVNDQYIGKDFDTYFHNVNIAYSEKSIANIKLILEGEKLTYSDSLFYYQDLDLFKNTTNLIKDSGLTEVKVQGNKVTGEFYSSNDKDYLFLNIPYDESWSIAIDGVQKKPEQVFDNQMAIETSKGTHTLKMKYIPKGFKLGSILSFISIFILITTSLYNIKRNN